MLSSAFNKMKKLFLINLLVFACFYITAQVSDGELINALKQDDINSLQNLISL
jgi:hypothetical protein